MVRTQIYLPEDELKAIHAIAKRSGKTVAQVVREAIRQVWLSNEPSGVVSIWKGPVKRSSMDHDSIYDEP